MRIAILYICTGKYEMFWDDFYRSCESFFYPGSDKEYYVFTDSKRIIEAELKNVHVYYQIRTGWPHDTLLRFQWFSSIQDLLYNFDYCYYLNANSKFCADVTKSEICFPTLERPLIFWCHTNSYFDNDASTFHPERNKESTAYVAEGTKCRCYGGGFFGGLSKDFVKMCNELRDNIMTDLNRGIIAVWHDQSHIIKYAIDHPHIEVDYGIISEEEYVPDQDKIKIVFLAKASFGGNDALREVGFATRFRHFPRKVYSQLLKFMSKFGLEGALRAFKNLLFGRLSK